MKLTHLFLAATAFAGSLVAADISKETTQLLDAPGKGYREMAGKDTKSSTTSFGPDTRMRSEIWNSFSESDKRVFIIGFSCALETPLKLNDSGKLAVSQSQFPDLVPLVDAFYKNPEHKDVLLSDAIEISILQFLQAPPDQIEKATDHALSTPQLDGER